MRRFEGIYSVTVGLERVVFLQLVSYLVILLEKSDRNGYKSLNKTRQPRDPWLGGEFLGGGGRK